MRILNNLTHEEVENLVVELDGKTLVGEFVIRNDEDTAFRYDHTAIYFYSIVDNNSRTMCLNPEAAYCFFTKFGLRYAPIEKIEVSYPHTFSKVVNIVNNLYEYIAYKNFQETDEGEVTLFLSNNS